jgi:tetratricopeptide (TPR) repeat protein
MHFANEKFELAIDDFEILADLYPEDNSIQHELGNCYSRKKDCLNAIYHYQLASQGGRGSDISRYNLAVTYFESNRLPEACEMWKFLIGNTKDQSIKSNCETFNNNYCR